MSKEGDRQRESDCWDGHNHEDDCQWNREDLRRLHFLGLHRTLALTVDIQDRSHDLNVYKPAFQTLKAFVETNQEKPAKLS